MPLVERIFTEALSSTIGFGLRMQLAKLQGPILNFLHLNELRSIKLDKLLFQFFKQCIEEENGGELEDTFFKNENDEDQDSDFEIALEEMLQDN